MTNNREYLPNVGSLRGRYKQKIQKNDFLNKKKKSAV